MWKEGGGDDTNLIWCEWEMKPSPLIKAANSIINMGVGGGGVQSTTMDAAPNSSSRHPSQD